MDFTIEVERALRVLDVAGIRPAINVGLSVSRVGGAAQIKAMKKVAGTLRLDLAQYRELAAFAQFGSDLDKATKTKLTRGERLVELLKQPQYKPMVVEEQVSVLYAGTRGFLDDVAVTDAIRFGEELVEFMRNQKSDILAEIVQTKDLGSETEKKLADAINEFKAGFKA